MVGDSPSNACEKSYGRVSIHTLGYRQMIWSCVPMDLRMLLVTKDVLCVEVVKVLLVKRFTTDGR